MLPDTRLRGRGGWFAVGVLLAAYTVSFLDRQLLTLLVQPIKADLGLSDSQIGILQGPAFALFYATMGLPLGWLADRVNRVHLMAAAIAFWSLMTFLCGFATEYTHLLLARFGVGFGEAALVPAAVSLLAELFKPERCALPVSVFTCGLAVGSGLALILGGSFIAVAEQGAGELPLVGEFLAAQAPWKVVFILAGVAGLPVTLVMLCLAEPRTNVRVTSGPPLSAVWDHLRTGRAYFQPLLASMAALFVVTTALSAWLPSVLIRDFGWTAIATGGALGPVILFGALIGNLTGGAVVTWLAARGRTEATLLTMLIGASVMVPSAVLTSVASSPEWLLGFAAVLYLAMAATFGVASLAFVEVTPAQLRGQVVAIYLLCANLLGLMLGPTAVGVFTDSGLSLLASVGHALALVMVLAGLPGLWWLWRALQRRAAVTVGVATIVAVMAVGGWTAPVASAAGEASPGVRAILEVREPWLRPSPPGVPVTAGYLTIINRGTTEDELLEVSTPRAGTVQVHETRMEQGVMRMRELERLTIAAGAQLALAPGGAHLMLMELTAPLRAGEQVPITLRFARGGERTVMFEVRTPR
jgi:copper(I)-binding protein/predicted MFS family arabinose efflux permease